MSQSPLNKRWFHKIVDYFHPNNCRAQLECAIVDNRAASTGLFCLIKKHEHEVIGALKNDRRHRVAK